MGFNNPFTRAAIQRLSTDPTVRKVLQKVKSHVHNHPHTRKIIADLRQKVSTAMGAGQKNATGHHGASASHNSGSASSTASTSHTNGASGPSSAKSGGFYEQANDYWSKHRDRVIGFVAANFMGILFFVQFGQQIWHLVVIWWSSDSSKIEDRRKRKRNTEQQQQASGRTGKVVVQGGTLQIALDISDNDTMGCGITATAFVPDPDNAFETSFSVKMGDSTTFESSLKSPLITGESIQPEGWFSAFNQDTSSTESLVFDMRGQSRMLSVSS